MNAETMKRLLRLLEDPDRLELEPESLQIRAALHAPSAQSALLQLLDEEVAPRQPSFAEILIRIDVRRERADDVARCIGLSRRHLFRLRAQALQAAALAAAICMRNVDAARFGGDSTSTLLAEAFAADAAGDIERCRLLLGIAERRMSAAGRPQTDAVLFAFNELRCIRARRFGDVPGARNCVGEMDRLATPNSSNLLRALLYRAELATVLGEPDVAEHLMHDARKTPALREDLHAMATLVFSRAQLAFSHGDFDTAGSEAQIAMELFRRHHQGYAMRAAALASRAALLANWDWEHPLVLSQRESWYASDTYAVTARYALRDGDLAAARTAAAHAVRCARDGHPALRAYALATQAAVAARAGDTLLAQRARRAAARFDMRMPHAVIRRDLWLA